MLCLLFVIMLFCCLVWVCFVSLLRYVTWFCCFLCLLGFDLNLLSCVNNVVVFLSYRRCIVVFIIVFNCLV